MLTAASSAPTSALARVSSSASIAGASHARTVHSSLRAQTSCDYPRIRGGYRSAVVRRHAGFSLHAAVHCGADDRQAIEQRCRCITRPALAIERVQTNAAGQVVLKLKTPWRDGTTHLWMSPLEST
jgi:hypothetical protein